MKISPGPAAAQMRAARFTIPPKKSPPSWIGSPVLMPMPMAIRVPVWLRFAAPRAAWIATAQMMAPFAVVKATMKLSPWVFTTWPPNVSICLRTIALCSCRTWNAASSPCWLVYSVNPRMSLKSRVTVELTVAEDLDLKLVDRRKAPDDTLDRRGKDVHAPDDEHVVEPAEDAAAEPHERAAARTRRRDDPHAVAGAVADHGRADAPEVGEDEPAVLRGPSGPPVDDLRDELGLVDMKPGLLGALVAVGTDLGHARMIVRPRAPPCLDACAHRGNGGARLARVDGESHAPLGEVLAALARHLDQVERVGRRAHEHGRPERLHPGEPRRGVLAAAGNCERPQGTRALEARPEADEQPEREREEDAVRRLDHRPAQDEPPATRPPLPRLRRVEPANRLPARARGLVDTHVALEGVREVAPEGGVRRLIVDDLDLAHMGQPPEVVPAREVVDRADARGTPLRTDERIGLEQLARHGQETPPLVRGHLLGWQCLQRAIEHACGLALSRVA